LRRTVAPIRRSDFFFSAISRQSHSGCCRDEAGVYASVRARDYHDDYFNSEMSS
jgi:hypothetical protein